MSGDIRNLWQAFARSAAAREHAPALVFEDEEVSFETLHNDAERCAAWLAKSGVQRGSIVVLQLPKRRETYALWLSCLRQGVTYVFSDPRNPLQRTQQILACLKPAFFFSTAVSENPYGARVVLADAAEGRAWLSKLPCSQIPPPAAVEGGDPAYVMFTSGSTGEPKGAVIRHQGVLSLMRWGRTLCDPSTSRFSNINPLHFDNSVFDLFCGLVNGATLVPVETGSLSNPAHWVRRLREGGANIIFGVPTLFQTLDQLKLLKPERLPGAKLFIFGGEGYPVAALKAFREKFAGYAELLNVYGPTETSCICSSMPIDEAALTEAKGLFPSLGRMHADFTFAILDDAGSQVKSGDAGELWIGGPNVGLGYFANEQETTLRFCRNPAELDDVSLWYRTGDLVRQDARGRLWFQGRVDNQVKVRGHRIELEEIDLAVEAIDRVTRAVAVVVDGVNGPEICVAFVAEEDITSDLVVASCVATLPSYMKPARVLQLEMLPINANGKVDRKAVRTYFESTRVAP